MIDASTMFYLCRSLLKNLQYQLVLESNLAQWQKWCLGSLWLSVGDIFHHFSNSTVSTWFFFLMQIKQLRGPNLLLCVLWKFCDGRQPSVEALHIVPWKKRWNHVEPCWTMLSSISGAVSRNIIFSNTSNMYSTYYDFTMLCYSSTI